VRRSQIPEEELTLKQVVKGRKDPSYQSDNLVSLNIISWRRLKANGKRRDFCGHAAWCDWRACISMRLEEDGAGLLASPVFLLDGQRKGYGMAERSRCRGDRNGACARRGSGIAGSAAAAAAGGHPECRERQDRDQAQQTQAA
jgi:hypothetical protein